MLKSLFKSKNPKTNEVIFSKRFDLENEDGHTTYLIITNKGDFTLGEVFNDSYHVVYSVRGNDVNRILSILNNPETWKFPDEVTKEELDG